MWIMHCVYSLSKIILILSEVLINISTDMSIVSNILSLFGMVLCILELLILTTVLWWTLIVDISFRH